jgi:hypothetical protein
MQKQNQVWNANLKLIEFGINNARQQLAFNDQWISGRAGLRDQFNQMMNSMTELAVNTILPQAIGAANSVASTQMGAMDYVAQSHRVRGQGEAAMWLNFSKGVADLGKSMSSMSSMGGGGKGGGIGGMLGGIMGGGSSSGSQGTPYSSPNFGASVGAPAPTTSTQTLGGTPSNYLSRW